MAYVFAEVSGWIARTVNRWSDRGEVTLERLLRVRLALFVPVMATLLVLILAAVPYFIDPTPCSRSQLSSPTCGERYVSFAPGGYESHWMPAAKSRKHPR